MKYNENRDRGIMFLALYQHFGEQLSRKQIREVLDSGDVRLWESAEDYAADLYELYTDETLGFFRLARYDTQGQAQHKKWALGWLTDIFEAHKGHYIEAMAHPYNAPGLILYHKGREWFVELSGFGGDYTAFINFVHKHWPDEKE